jgi:hypothetical protein
MKVIKSFCYIKKDFDLDVWWSLLPKLLEKNRQIFLLAQFCDHQEFVVGSQGYSQERDYIWMS